MYPLSLMGLLACCTDLIARQNNNPPDPPPGPDVDANAALPAVVQAVVNGKQHTMRFHVDDLMCSHVDSKVNTKFLKWLNLQHGTCGEVKATRGHIHDCLGMEFDFA